MKKKIVLISLMVAMLVCVLAISIGATTYNYYENEVAEGNKLYSLEASFSTKNTRFELISSITGEGFAKTDSDGTALTWYVVADDLDSDKDGVRNIVVKSTPTIGGVVGNTDENGNYTYAVDADGVSFSKKVVSVNFFKTNVTTLPEQAYMATYSLHTPGQLYQYCQIADGSYLLALYLPKTLTAIPKQLCFRSPVIVLEFEDNQVIYETFGEGVTGFDAQYPEEIAYAFSFCANLKSLTIPEGIKTIAAHTFRESLSLSYLKFPSTMTRLENNVFFHSVGFETVIFGENMTYIGYLNSDYKKIYSDWEIRNFNIKYMYVPNTINTANSKFDSYRGQEKNYINVARNLVFFFAGTKAEAQAVSAYTDKHFKSAVSNKAITYTEYLENKSTYDSYTGGHILVYDVPLCTAFHNGQHEMVEINTYKDALTPFEIGNICANCKKGGTTEYAPIIEVLGYSAKINGDLITVGYKVNKESLALFPEISYGIVAVVPNDNADLSAYEPLKADLTVNVEDYVITSPVDTKYEDFNIILNSFDASYYEVPFVMCAYVADGEKVDYLCHNELNQIVQTEYAKCISFKFIAEECAPKYNVTFTCDSTMGALNGELSQIVMDGKKTTAVTAVAKEGYQFACWSDGTKTPTIEYLPEEATELVAYFTHASTDTDETKGLPVFEINTLNGLSITSKDVYTDCYITLLDTETGNSIGGELAEIKGRGNSTWEKFDKKPYKFKFEDKQNLFGYGAEKTWVLLADARDYSLLRNMLALNAGLTMSELGYTSQGQSVELYLNGEYQGVYYLCEQIQVKKNRVNITQENDEIEQGPEDIGWLIEMDAWVSEDKGGVGNIPTYGVTSDGDVFVRVDDGMYNGYVIKDPEDILFDKDGNLKEKFMTYIQTYIKNSLAAVSGDDYAAVCELIDVKSFAQAYIIFDLFKNPDTQYSSVYFYKDVDGKLVAAPLWDFDMAIGNVTHKKNCGTNASNFRNTTFLWTATQNTWFRELLEFDEFKALVGQELAENADNIRASIAADLKYAKDHMAAYEKNFEKWDLIGNTGASEKMGAWSVPAEFKAFDEWVDHLDYIEDYLEASLTYLLEKYPAPVAE